MNTPDPTNTGRPVEDIASEYVSGVRGLFAAPAGAPTAERGGRGLPATPGVADRATTLSPVSANLTRALSAQLGAADTGEREQSATKLLAKALTDLQVSQHLYSLASDEEDGATRGPIAHVDRGVATAAVDEEALNLLVAGPAPRAKAHDRSAPRSIGDINTARVELSTAAQDTLAAISEQAAKTGQSALAGLLGLGVADLAKAAGIVGMDIAGVLGQADKVGKLYELCRGFLSNAYNSLLALIGQSVAQTAAKQVLDWVDKLRAGALFGDLLEKAYDTKQIGKEINALVEKSQASLDNFTATTDKVKALGDGYARQTAIAGRVLMGARFVGGLPLAVLPQGRLVLAAAYIILGSYIVLAGADYVDARHLEPLKRVPGVEEVVTSGLSG